MSCLPGQAALLHALREQSRQLRQTVGTCVAAVVGAAGLAAWPELVQRLAQGLDGGDALQLEGALDALHKVGGTAKQGQPGHGCWQAMLQREQSLRRESSHIQRDGICCSWRGTHQ